MSFPHREISFINLSAICIVQIYIDIIAIAIYIYNDPIDKICLMEKFLQLIFKFLGQSLFLFILKLNQELLNRPNQP